jgi:diguanylate cyclase (GGDEF)-like protein
MKITSRRPGVLGWFSILSILAMAVIGVALLWALGAEIRDGALRQATRSAELVTETAIEDAIGSDDPRDGLAAATIARLDAFVARATGSASLTGLGIWTPRGELAYANDSALIGHRFPIDRELERALRGEAQIEVVERARDAADPRIPHADDEIEIHVPLVPTGQRRPVGVAEITVDAGPVQAEIARERWRLALAICAGLVLLFGILLTGVAAVSRRLRRQVDHNRLLALHDPLTGLPNRTLFHDRVAQCGKERRRAGQEAAVMVLDLDRFKEVNDTLGHRTGDLLLVEVARRLSSRLRQSDTLARLGGDEFAVLLPLVDGVRGVRKVLEGLHTALCAPFVLDGVTLTVEASIGVSLIPEHGADPDVLIERADVSMYTAKAARSGHAIYDPVTDNQERDQLALVGDLRRAIGHGELRLLYQPKAELASRRIRSVEALVRWQHPERGLLGPDAFIPLAESSGLIRQLTYWVLDEALRQCREWAGRGRSLKVAVNLSQESLLDPTISTAIALALERHQIPAQALEIEITESALVADLGAANETLKKLHAMGVSISIDDYGTGYSSLAHLRGLPITCIKIDRSFVSGMLTESKNATIVRSTIALARDLRIGVVAEGVERQEEWDALEELGCWVAQGYLVSRPRTGDDLFDWLQRIGGMYRMEGEAAIPLPDFA